MCSLKLQFYMHWKIHFPKASLNLTEMFELWILWTNRCIQTGDCSCECSPCICCSDSTSCFQKDTSFIMWLFVVIFRQPVSIYSRLSIPCLFRFILLSKSHVVCSVPTHRLFVRALESCSKMARTIEHWVDKPVIVSPRMSGDTMV